MERAMRRADQPSGTWSAEALATGASIEFSVEALVGSRLPNGKREPKALEKCPPHILPTQ